MGRPVNADSAKTIERIQVAALKILEHDGLEAITVRDVARAAGVSVGTLRYYFPSHSDLLEACLDSYHVDLANLQAKLAVLLSSATSPRKTAAVCVQAIFDHLAARPELARLRLVLTSREGGLPRERRNIHRAKFLTSAVTVLSFVPGAKKKDIRLLLDSASRIVTSYAACSDEEACDITEESDPILARQKLCDHGVEVCLQLIFGDER